jgi:hypothetical protein
MSREMTMDLEELLRRYRIPDDVDIEAELARASWHDDAVKDIFGAPDPSDHADTPDPQPQPN